MRRDVFEEGEANLGKSVGWLRAEAFVFKILSLHISSHHSQSL